LDGLHKRKYISITAVLYPGIAGLGSDPGRGLTCPDFRCGMSVVYQAENSRTFSKNRSSRHRSAIRTLFTFTTCGRANGLLYIVNRYVSGTGPQLRITFRPFRIFASLLVLCDRSHEL
jgi:hypothetical protein